MFSLEENTKGKRHCPNWTKIREILTQKYNRLHRACEEDVHLFLLEKLGKSALKQISQGPTSCSMPVLVISGLFLDMKIENYLFFLIVWKQLPECLTKRQELKKGFCVR